MHSLSTSFVLGYHGCSKAAAESLLRGDTFRLSDNPYDWLGRGVYFWESNPRRGLEFYRETQTRKNKDPDDVAVVGAVIDMGFSLDLSSSSGVAVISVAFEQLEAIFKMLGKPIPENRFGKDKLLRDLDCAVINYLHDSRVKNDLRPFDTVRAVFQEGAAAYPNSGFKARTHTQIAVCNLKNIRGVFRVPADDI